MAKFITLTRLKSGDTFALNIETIEYMLPILNRGGTALVSITNHTKYEVSESMEDILFMLEDHKEMIDGPIAVG